VDLILFQEVLDICEALHLIQLEFHGFTQLLPDLFQGVGKS
jgi:hypothetical protein